MTEANRRKGTLRTARRGKIKVSYHLSGKKAGWVQKPLGSTWRCSYCLQSKARRPQLWAQADGEKPRQNSTAEDFRQTVLQGSRFFSPRSQISLLFQTPRWLGFPRNHLSQCFPNHRLQLNTRHTSLLTETLACSSHCSVPADFLSSWLAVHTVSPGLLRAL